VFFGDIKDDKVIWKKTSGLDEDESVDESRSNSVNGRSGDIGIIKLDDDKIDVPWE
jgi:hypothetical protein